MSRSPSRRPPPEEDKPARRSWRGAANGAARSEAARFGWRQGRAPRNERAIKWLLGVPMILVVLGLLFGWYVVTFRDPPPTPLVCLLVTDYEPPVPPQSFAQEDVERLLSLFKPVGGAGSIAVSDDAEAKPIGAATKEAFLSQLVQALNEQPPNAWYKKPQLVYLSVQCVVSPDGRPCLLLPAGKRESQPAIRTPRQVLADERLLPVEELIDAVADVHDRAYKVLLLDGVRWDRNWRLGKTNNEFAAALEKISFKGRERVVVLHGSSAGEVGLVDLGKGHTLFGEFVARGLAGEANTSGDDEITLQEFHAYLTKGLAGAAAWRGRTQRPLLAPADPQLDFPLATVNPSTKAAAVNHFETARFEPDQTWLNLIHEGWSKIGNESAQADDSGDVLVAAAARQHWQRQLDYCLAGSAYRTYRGPLVSVPSAPRAQMPALSLPVAFGSLDPPAEAIERAKAALQPPPADQPPPAAAPPLNQYDYRDLSNVVWSDVLAGKPVSDYAREKLARARSDAGSLPPVELQALARFSAANPHLPKSLKDATAELRQLLAIRHHAERAAFAGGEPRGLAFLRSPQDAADERRRQLEDQAFGDRLESAALAKLEQDFLALEQRAAELAKALALRDQVWAELPDLLEWAASGGKDREQQAAALLQGLGALEAALAREGEAPAEPRIDWPKLIDAVSKPRQALLAVYAREWENNVSQTPTEGMLSQISALERLIACPLDHLADRGPLWRKYWEIVRGLRGREAQSGKDQPPGLARQAERIAEAQRTADALFTQWLNIVPRPAGQPDVGRQLAEARFLALVDRVATEIRPLEAKDIADGPLREQLAAREAACRAAAPWLTLSSSAIKPGDHVIDQRREQAAHDYCLWQAQRSLDDFSGADDDPAAASAARAAVAAGQKAYFAQAAAAWIEHAETNLFPRRPAAAQRELMAGRVRDARLLKSVGLSWPTGPIATGQQSYVVQRLPQPLDVRALPAGQATMQISGDWTQVAVDAAPPAAAGLFPVQVTANDSGWPAKFEFFLDPERTSAAGSVSYYYRGHAWSVPGRIDRLEPRYSVVSSSPGTEGRIEIGSPTVKAHVVIVLDCSASMGSREGSRMHRARDAVKRTVHQLLEAQNSQLRVGLILFGHRRRAFTSWPKPGETISIPWNDAFGPDTDKVPYDRDFQIVWTNRQSEKELDDLIVKITGTGYTPLYSALDFALNDGFKLLAGRDAADAEIPKHLVVVTDGEDDIPSISDSLTKSGYPADYVKKEQFVPAWDQDYNSEPERDKRTGRILRAMPGKHLVVFDVTGAGLKRVRDDLMLRGEDIVAVGEEDDLPAALLREAGIRKYQLGDGTPESRVSGVSSERQDLTRGLGLHWLQFAHDRTIKAFRIGGGEALAVTIPAAPEKPEFLFAPQPTTTRAGIARGIMTLPPGSVEEDFRTTLAAYQVLASAQRGKKGEADADRCDFELVLQNTKPGEFTPRPVEVLVEIAPRDASGPRPAGDGTAKYTFSNPFCEPGTRAPVYRLTVPRWPAGADRAAVNVWLRTRATSSLEVPVIRSTTHSESAPASPTEQDGATFRFESREDKNGAVAKITESHSGEGVADDRFYFVIPASDLALTRVERTYYQGQVEHLFFLSGTAEDARRAQILAVPQAKWKASAIALDGEMPLEVVIPAE